MLGDSISYALGFLLLATWEVFFAVLLSPVLDGFNQLLSSLHSPLSKQCALSINLYDIKIWKNLGNAENRTRGRWVRSKYAIHCAMRPPRFVKLLFGFSFDRFQPLRCSHEGLRGRDRPDPELHPELHRQLPLRRLSRPRWSAHRGRNRDQEEREDQEKVWTIFWWLMLLIVSQSLWPKGQARDAKLESIDLLGCCSSTEKIWSFGGKWMACYCGLTPNKFLERALYF